MSPISPAVAQWELNLRLRRRCRAMGMDTTTLIGHVGVSHYYWSGVEHNRRLLSQEQLRRLIALLELDTVEGAELLELWTQAMAPRWWAPYTKLLGKTVDLLGREAGASRIRAYESTIVTGLLQTPAYTRAVLSAFSALTAANIELLMELQSKRLLRLHGEHPLRLRVLMGEGVLRQQPGGRVVQREQLHYLADIVMEPDIDVRVLPFAATGGGIIGSAAFLLLDFASPHLPVAAWQQTIPATGFQDDKDYTRSLGVIFDNAWDETADDTVDHIRRALREL